jgi:hypothetical protein
MCEGPFEVLSQRSTALLGDLGARAKCPKGLRTCMLGDAMRRDAAQHAVTASLTQVCIDRGGGQLRYTGSKRIQPRLLNTQHATLR